jgi:hypothetical protein
MGQLPWHRVCSALSWQGSPTPREVPSSLGAARRRRQWDGGLSSMFRERKVIPEVGSKEESMKKDGDRRVDEAISNCLPDVCLKRSAFRSLMREILKLIGTDWNSLLREARFLKERY